MKQETIFFTTFVVSGISFVIALLFSQMWWVFIGLSIIFQLVFWDSFLLINLFVLTPTIK